MINNFIKIVLYTGAGYLPEDLAKLAHFSKPHDLWHARAKSLNLDLKYCFYWPALYLRPTVELDDIVAFINKNLQSNICIFTSPSSIDLFMGIVRSNKVITSWLKTTKIYVPGKGSKLG